MLRITVEEQNSSTTFRLEGKLKGDWVPELERCWREARSTNPNRHLMIDLVAVSFVDERGKFLLKKLASRHTAFSTHGNPLMCSLVNELAGARRRGRLPRATSSLQPANGR